MDCRFDLWPRRSGNPRFIFDMKCVRLAYSKKWKRLLNNGKMWGWGCFYKMILKLACLGTFNPAYCHRIQSILNIPNVSLLAIHLKTNASYGPQWGLNVFLPLKYLYTVKKSFLIFPSQAGMSLTKVSLGGNHESIPAQGDFGIPAGDGNIENLFLRRSIF